MASSLSWILRSSSVPVLRQSARRRRREEARSWQRSRVSSAGASQDLLSSPSHPFPPPSARQSSQNSQSSLTRSTAVTQALTSRALDMREGRLGRRAEKRNGAAVGALDNLPEGCWCQAHRGESAGRSCAAPGSRFAALPHPCTPCPGCRSCRHRHRPAPRGAPVSTSSLSLGASSSLPVPWVPPSKPTQPRRTALPYGYNLSSLLKSTAGILQEGEGFGRRHLMDGRGLVPQVDSELLYEARAIIAHEVCTPGSSPWASQCSPAALTTHPTH